MKALVYTGERSLELREVADPEPGEDEALVRVEAVGICGSDMHAFLGHDERRPAPLILGHEAAGTVVAGELAGRRVTINPLVTCMACPACRSGRENLCARRQIISMPPRAGAFAQYVGMPIRNLFELPADIAIEKAALVEPLACGWHAVRIAQDSLRTAWKETRVLVLGGGAIGFGAFLALRCRGAGSVVLAEPNSLRRAFLASREAVDVRPPEGISVDGGFDLVIDAVGVHQTRKSASQKVAPGGGIVHIGLGDNEGGLDLRRLTLQEVSFIGTYTYTRSDFEETARALFAGRLGRLEWADLLPLDAGPRVFAELLAGECAAPKVVLAPWSNA